MGIGAVIARLQTTGAWLAGRLVWHDRWIGAARQDLAGERAAGGRDAGAAGRPAGQPSRLRSFDSARVADLEYRAWVGYYQHKWYQALMAFVGLIRMGYGMDWCRTLHAALLALRAIQLWAPLPDNDPDGARARMRRFYALVRLSYGEPASPAKAAELEVDWWRAHRQVQYSVPGVTCEDLVESVTRLYCYLFGESEAAVRPSAVYRVQAMGLSDQWIREGCPPDSPLLPLVHAALVHSYAALLAAVHH
jgi:hypothetical protein